jgi:hypothetical protein
LFGVLGTAVISLTFLPALSVMVLGLRTTQPASAAGSPDAAVKADVAVRQAGAD